MATLTDSPTTAEVLAGITLVRAQLAEQYPTASTAPGSAVDGLLVAPSGYLAALHTARGDEALLRGSIQALTDGLETATDADVDALATNYFVVRNVGTSATGLIKIVTQTATPYVLPLGFQVAFSDLTFSAPYEQRAYPAATVGITASTTNRLMILRADGLYEFTIQVTADQSGPASRLGRGTALTLSNAATGMVSSAVDTDFSGGTADETNADLLARLGTGITQAAVAGAAHIQALVAASYPEARIAAIGVGSTLMTRDQASVLGISQGGRLDVYVRSGQTVGSQTVTLNGTVTVQATKTVTITIPRPTSDGLYRVTAIRPSSYVGVGGNVPATLTTSSVTTSPFTPSLPTFSDRAFSANAQVVLTFIDTLGVGTYVNAQVRSYAVDFLYMPQVRALADLLVGVNRPPGTDILVKGGVPCITQVQLTVRIPVGTTGPTVGTMQSLVANAINALDFGTATLSSFVVHRALASVLTVGEVTAASFNGSILCPDGTSVTLISAASLTLTEDASKKIGAANTFFTCGVNDVAITLTT